MKRAVLILTCLGLLLLGSGMAAADITTGLIAYYPFTGNANDIVGGNNGTVYGTTPLTADRFGRPNRAYHFDGSDSHIEMAHNFDFVDMGDLTFSAWVKNEGNGTGYVFYNGTLGELGIAIYSGKTDFYVHLANTSYYEALDTGVLPQDKFVHITGVYYARQKIELWLNGNLITTTNLDNYNLFNPTWNTFYANIGAYHEAGHNLVGPFQGTIYEVRIYNRALTAADIKQLATFGNPITGLLSLLLD